LRDNDRLTHLQVAPESAKDPPITGPKIVPAPQTIPTPPIYTGRSRSVVLMVSRFKFPRYIPAPPIPAITLPTMSAFILGAAPQIALPIAKVVTLPICSHLTLKMPYALPLNSH
jgi:hypothetical protein